MNSPLGHSTLRFNRREFLRSTGAWVGAAGLACLGRVAEAQSAGDRPPRATGVQVLNPRLRVPVNWIIDDSTCLVNLNKFAMPQFDAAFGGKNPAYHKDWRSWSSTIPDDFVRRFGDWCGQNGVKGKYSIVPYPACVGRLDGELPGWSPREVKASIDLVRTLMAPNWDIHPEMVTHTRVIDLRTGHPFPERTLRFMENWDWTTGKSVDEIAAYQSYALQILKNVGLDCDGLTTPGGYGNQARPQLAQATLDSVRSVFGAAIPHYFRDAFDEGIESVAPRVELASGLDTGDPRCVVSIVACTGDWTGGWDNSEVGNPDQFISRDGRSGRLAEILRRAEPACLLSHWTGIWWNGEERGFRVFQEVVRRLNERADDVLWMKLTDIARYWAAKELTRIEPLAAGGWLFQAPFAAPAFTVRLPWTQTGKPQMSGPSRAEFREVSQARELRAGTWLRQKDQAVLCFDLPKGPSHIGVGGG